MTIIAADLKFRKLVSLWAMVGIYRFTLQRVWGCATPGRSPNMFERVDKQSLGVEYPPACESERRRAEWRLWMTRAHINPQNTSRETQM